MTGSIGAVTGFGADDVIDLGGQSVKSLNYAGTQVTVTLVGGATDTFSLSTAATALKAISDGAGGTEIVAAASPFALTTGTDIVAFSSGANTVTATSATLNAGDSLTGGTGVDTLTLRGGGTFNLASLAAFSFDSVMLATGPITPSRQATSTSPPGKRDRQRTSTLRRFIAELRRLRGDGRDIRLFGGAGDDTLTGGAGNDTLNGEGGVNIMRGGAGDDTYFVNNAADQVIEAVGNGLDTVAASVSYALLAGSEIETLQTQSATGTTAINLTGNGFAQRIVGNAGANVIDGGGGNDTLVGGAGADTFVFDNPLNAATNDPTITDFTVGTDKFQLAQSVFTALPTGALPAADFVVGAAATTANQHILYNSGTGALSYDADGNGADAAVQFATISKNLALTSSSFTVV